MQGASCRRLPEPALAPLGLAHNPPVASERGGILKRTFGWTFRAFFAAAAAIDDDVVANVADGARIHRRKVLFVDVFSAARSAGPNNRAGEDRRRNDIGQSVAQHRSHHIRSPGVKGGRRPRAAFNADSGNPAGRRFPHRIASKVRAKPALRRAILRRPRGQPRECRPIRRHYLRFPPAKSCKAAPNGPYAAKSSQLTPEV